MLAAAVSALTACAASRPSAEAAIYLPALPANLTRCDRPVALPSGPLTQADVEQLWGRDRAALVKCGLSLDGLVAYYQGLSANLSAADRGGR